MTSKQLKEKLEAAEAKVEKIKGTIERHQKQADKKLQNIKNNGWELDKYQYAGGMRMNKLVEELIQNEINYCPKCGRPLSAVEYGIARIE